MSEEGKFGGAYEEISGRAGPFLSWTIGQLSVGPKTYPVHSGTGVGGTEAAAVFNLMNKSRDSAVSYVSNLIRSQVMVDAGKGGLTTYLLSANIRSFGYDEGLDINLSQTSPRGTARNREAAVKYFAEQVIDRLGRGYYGWLGRQGWQRAGTVEGPEPEAESEELAF
jgi:hypothetical protein